MQYFIFQLHQPIYISRTLSQVAEKLCFSFDARLECVFYFLSFCLVFVIYHLLFRLFNVLFWIPLVCYYNSNNCSSYLSRAVSLSSQSHQQEKACSLSPALPLPLCVISQSQRIRHCSAYACACIRMRVCLCVVLLAGRRTRWIGTRWRRGYFVVYSSAWAFCSFRNFWTKWINQSHDWGEVLIFICTHFVDAIRNWSIYVVCLEMTITPPKLPPPAPDLSLVVMIVIWIKM